jgi:hypothetical protein
MPAIPLVYMALEKRNMFKIVVERNDSLDLGG